MDVEFIAIMIPIVLIIGVIVMIIYLRKYENQERMEMVSKGIDPAQFARKQTNPSVSLRASLLLIGAGFGLLIGYFLDRQFYMEEVGYFSMLLILGGAGLGAAYVIEERKSREVK